MRKILLFLPITLSFMASSTLFTKPYPAITIVPVADLIGDSLQRTFGTKNSISSYNELPLCSKKDTDCLRIGQALYLEPVIIHEENGEEVKISITNLFFQTTNNTTKNSLYWSLKKNFMPIAQLIKNNINLSQIPTALHYDTSSLHENVRTKGIITLIMPHCDPITQRTFSAGTRFVVAKNTIHSFLVYVLNQNGSKIITMEVPQKKAIAQKKRGKEEQIELCLSTLKTWAQQHQQGFIPYVWGGCSFTRYCNHEEFSLISSLHYGNSYQRSNYETVPKTGFDCTGLLARAAQAAGMPYYFKNSTTIVKNLKPRSATDPIENGDVIWIPGHIMIISDVKKGLIIEARSYEHGWGKIHEVPIHVIFKDIFTLKNLLAACTTQQPLERLNREGVVTQKVTACKILSIRSIWDQ